MVSVQSTGCAPIVRAWNKGEEFAEFWDGAETISSGIRVPSALGDFLILDAIRSSGGFAVSVTDEETLEMQYEIGLREGLLLCPEGAATVAAYRNSLDSGLVSSSDSVVLFNTATGLKYPMPEVVSSIDKNNVDYSYFSSK
jgi:threonine synthase